MSQNTVLHRPHVPSLNILQTLLARILRVSAMRRSRLVAAWRDYFRELDAEPSKTREERLHREAHELIARVRNLDTGAPRSETDSVIPPGVEDDLELAGIDEELMWMPRAVQALVLRLAEEYDGLDEPLEERRAEAMRVRLANEYAVIRNPQGEE